MSSDGNGAAVVVDTVCKSFGNGNVVDRVSFTVNRGASFGLLGPNGAGKSTTLMMIYGFLRPSSGRIEVEGFDITRCAREVKKRLGVAPQDETLDPDLTVSENLLFHARYFGFSRKRSKRHVNSLLEMMSLYNHRAEPVGNLSTGMRRRLLLSRAHINNPSVLILDEPTRGLDSASRSKYLEFLGRLKEDGVTLIVATHDLEEAGALCDFAAVMDCGKIVDIGEAGRVLHKVNGLEELSPAGAAEET